jgi:hypothetical protein
MPYHKGEYSSRYPRIRFTARPALKRERHGAHVRGFVLVKFALRHHNGNALFGMGGHPISKVDRGLLLRARDAASHVPKGGVGRSSAARADKRFYKQWVRRLKEKLVEGGWEFHTASVVIASVSSIDTPFGKRRRKASIKKQFANWRTAWGVRDPTLLPRDGCITSLPHTLTRTLSNLQRSSPAFRSPVLFAPRAPQNR